MSARRARARMTTLRMRDARPEDAEALHAMRHAAYADRGPERPLVDTLEDTLRDITDGLVLVAEDEAGRIVGSVHLRRVANVRRLAVAPDAKGEGVGAALLEAAVERARRDGFAYAMLDTLPDHPWLPEFYRRHGFEERCLERFPNGVDWLAFRRRLL